MVPPHIRVHRPFTFRPRHHALSSRRSLCIFLLPVPVRALPAVVALALFPLALGHTLYMAALRRLHSSILNLIATQEVTGGILLAWLLLGETPRNALAGAAIRLLGVGLVLW